MAAPEIKIIQENPSAGSVYFDELVEVFFQSSARKDFATQADRDHFFQQWTDYYLNHVNEHVYLAVSEADKKLYGYLMGCSNSAAAEKYYSEVNPSYLTFSDHFSRFPAHLHVNCGVAARGMGVGTLLMARFFQDLRSKRVKGVHIVTSPESRNTMFYLRNRFLYQLNRDYRGFPLFLMGRTL